MPNETWISTCRCYAASAARWVTLFDDRENGFGARESARTGDRIRETMQPYGGFVIVVEP